MEYMLRKIKIWVYVNAIQSFIQQIFIKVIYVPGTALTLQYLTKQTKSTALLKAYILGPIYIKILVWDHNYIGLVKRRERERGKKEAILIQWVLFHCEKSCGQCGSVAWASSHKPKGHDSIPSQGTCLGRLWVWSPFRAYMKGNQWMILSHISVSLPLFLFLFPFL